jgi:oligopeptide/dipeptide ABC transporter ATP-binding protein
LLNAAPRLSVGAEALESIPGSPPDLIEPPPGCKFHERCPFVTEVCKTTQPPLVNYEDGRWAACHETERVLAEAAVTRKAGA